MEKRQDIRTAYNISVVFWLCVELHFSSLARRQLPDAHFVLVHWDRIQSENNISSTQWISVINETQFICSAVIQIMLEILKKKNWILRWMSSQCPAAAKFEKINVAVKWKITHTEWWFGISDFYISRSLIAMNMLPSSFTITQHRIRTQQNTTNQNPNWMPNICVHSDLIFSVNVDIRTRQVFMQIYCTIAMSIDNG